MSRTRTLLLLATAVWAPAACVTAPNNSDLMKVIRKGRAPRGPFVVVDAGKNRGIKRGDHLCFPGEDGASICGEVVTVRETAVGVNISDSDAAKVTIGAVASPSSAPTSETKAADATAIAEPAEVDDLATPGTPEPKTTETSGTEPNAPDDKRRSMIRAQYLFSLVQPVTYEAVAFNPKSRTDKTAATWVGTKTVTNAAFGLKLDWTRPWRLFGSDKLSMRPALFLFLNDDVAADARYDAEQIKSTTRTVTSGGIYGFSFDAAYRVFGGERFGLDAVSGLSAIYSAVAVDSTLEDASVNKSYKIASYGSYLYAACLDVGLSLGWQLGPVAITADANGLVPLVKLASGNSGYVDFSDGAFGVADYRLGAVDSGVNHRATSFGFNIAIGAGYSF